MEDKKRVVALKTRYATLAKQLGATRLIVQGTITERTIRKKGGGANVLEVRPERPFFIFVPQLPKHFCIHFLTQARLD